MPENLNMCLKQLVSLICFLELVHSKQTWIKDGAFNGFMPSSGYQSDVTNARSLIECGLLCGGASVCLSFFYSRSPAICQLHDVVINTTTGLNIMPSTKYYIRESYSGSYLNYWVDLTNIDAADFSDVNQWVSSAGSLLPIGNDFWGDGQPKTRSTSHCAALAHKKEYKLTNRLCDKSYYYICEKDY